MKPQKEIEMKKADKSVEEIIDIIDQGNFCIKKQTDEKSIITFYNVDMEKINIIERASGLMLHGDIETTAITVDDFAEIRDWAWDNLEEKSIMDILYNVFS